MILYIFLILLLFVSLCFLIQKLFFYLIQGVDPTIYETKVCQGRVVYLKPPGGGTENDSSSDNQATAVCAGTAVIDSGPYTGQRIEFEAEQCFLFGYCLARADFSFIFQASK